MKLSPLVGMGGGPGAPPAVPGMMPDGRRRAESCRGLPYGSGPAHVGVALALAAEAAFGAVARDEHGLVAHGPQALDDAVDQLLVVALGKVGAADAAREQHVSHEGAVDLRRMEHRSEEHTSELQSPCNLVCRLLLEKKNITSDTTQLSR